jgi:hypothetical protein
MPATSECPRFELHVCGIESADRLNYFCLSSVVPLCNLLARVTEQVAGSLNADFIAADSAAKIVLGKPLFDVRFFEQPCHETLRTLQRFNAIARQIQISR